MQTKYLTPADKDAFLDFPEIGKPNNLLVALCPQCKGYGGWNLKVNEYSLPKGMEDTPENRHKYVHFRASCDHCNGWGYVELEDTGHIHKWRQVANLGNCYNQYRCEICGKIRNVDSSG